METDKGIVVAAVEKGTFEIPQRTGCAASVSLASPSRASHMEPERPSGAGGWGRSARTHRDRSRFRLAGEASTARHSSAEYSRAGASMNSNRALQPLRRYFESSKGR